MANSNVIAFPLDRVRERPMVAPLADSRILYITAGSTDYPAGWPGGELGEQLDDLAYCYAVVLKDPDVTVHHRRSILEKYLRQDSDWSQKLSAEHGWPVLHCGTSAEGYRAKEGA